MSTVTATPKPTVRNELSLARINLMRAGYAFMAVGLALVKWPQLPEARTLPLFEGTTLALLTAMSLLAILGLRYPVKLLPLLLFETTWKLLWLALVALPVAVNGDMGAAMSQVAFNCTFVVFIIAATPWRYVWSQYVRADGDGWRR
ncbi:hypothetical protein EXE59_16405 [Nocardioides eburneiflavus]|uniref:DoxX family protein n=1 Tax=Nocardioides eburneiflavus TaxID=2518372 RepID=A0A4Z1CCG5_9ACTN|nr:hypothetical protein [Nocardioides eburneiflavus]TGN65366.1 hypothetical protein EXE59_16405 [Nocardioides eburneiflavus]